VTTDPAATDPAAPGDGTTGSGNGSGSGGVDGVDAGGNGGGLAETGADDALLIGAAAALVLVLAGTGLVIARRRA
jgi:LPXTG-motif cell wall-anchored protein